MYCVPVKAEDRGRLTEDEITCQFMHILDDAPCLANPPPVGILTAADRPHWAQARETLLCGKDGIILIGLFMLRILLEILFGIATRNDLVEFHIN